MNRNKKKNKENVAWNSRYFFVCISIDQLASIKKLWLLSLNNIAKEN